MTVAVTNTKGGLGVYTHTSQTQTRIQTQAQAQLLVNSAQICKPLDHAQFVCWVNSICAQIESKPGNKILPDN